MSPSWRERLHVVLCPQRVILVRFGRGMRPQVVDKDILPCTDSVSSGLAAWQPALDALRLGLSGHKRWHNADVRVILSNHFVRYLVMAWDEKLTAAEEQLAMVSYNFSQVYGDAAAEWDYRWSEGRPPAPCLACAIDRSLLAAIRESLADPALGLRLSAIQPYLMAAFNHWRREMDGQHDWFLLAESGRMCLAWFKELEWAGLHSQLLGPEWGGELPQILERVRLLAGLTEPPARLCIHAPEVPESGIVMPENWAGNLLRLKAAPGFNPADDRPYAMAMNS